MKFLRLSLVAMLVCSLGVSCGDSSDAPMSVTTQAVTTEAVDSSTLFAALESLGSYPREWNENQIDWVVAFQDPAVSYSEFLRVQLSVQTAQSGLVTRLGYEVHQLPPDLADAFQPIIDHYSHRLGLLEALFAAAATGTDREFEVALTNYQSYVGTALEMFDSVLTHPAIESVAEAEGVSTSELSAALREALGG